MKKKYKAIVIGAGKIGGQFDFPNANKVLTHAHAYTKHPKIEFLGFVDCNLQIAKKIAKRWNVNYYAELDNVFTTYAPDIVSICTPNETHFDLLVKLSDYKPKIVICEKPITTSLADTSHVIALYKKFNIPLLVNYTRRFLIEVQRLKEHIDLNAYGKILCASGIYNKGILHNGSHMIDLCRHLFGEVKNFIPLHHHADYSHDDKTISGFLQFDKCKQFFLQTGDSNKYSIFELDILFEKRRVKFIDSDYKMKYQVVKQDGIFKKYATLGKENTVLALKDPLYNLVVNAIDYLENKDMLKCDVEEAFETQKICVDIKNAVIQD